MATVSVTYDFVSGTTSYADHVDQNFNDLVTFLNASVSHVDGTRAFTAPVSGVTPTADAHLATKAYVDDATAVAAMYLSSSQSFASSMTATQVDLNTELGNTDATLFEVDTTNHRIKFLKSGYLYIAVGMVRWDGHVTGDRCAVIRKNAINQSLIIIPTCTIASMSTRINICHIGTAVTNDYFELWGFQSSGGALNAEAGSTDGCWLKVQAIGYDA